MTFLDPQTLQRLGPVALRRAAITLSAAGTRLRDTLPPFPPEDLPALHQHLAALRTLDHHLAADPTLEDRLSATLSQLGDPLPALQTLANDTAPPLPALFAVHTLLLTLRDTLRILEPHPALHPEAPPIEAGPAHRESPTPLGTTAGLLDLMHPGDAPKRRFQLHHRLHPALGPAREDLRTAVAEHAAALATRRTAIEAHYAARVTAERHLALPAEHPALDEARSDPRLQRVSSSAWEHVFALVADEELARLAAREHDARAAVEQAERAAREVQATALRPHLAALHDALDWLARLDLQLALVRLRRAWNGCWPEPGDALDTTDARLPSLEDRLRAQGIPIQPLAFRLDTGTTRLVGPNMGGKTRTLQLAGTLQLLAQLGWPVPATTLTFQPVHRIAWIGGDPEDPASGLSRFGAEMTTLADALAAPGTALLLLDEIGSATNPTEGAALATAVAEHLHDSPHTAFFATHFPDLPSARRLPTLRVAGLAAVDDDTLRELVRTLGREAALGRVIDYTLRTGDDTQPPMDALRIAAALDLPQTLLERASTLLQDPDDPS